MNWRVMIVWTVKLLAAALIVWWGRHWLVGIKDVYEAGNPYAVMDAFLKFIAIAGLLLALFLFDLVLGVGNRVAGFIFPEVDDVEVRPQYSRAEARASEGHYEEAIAEFRKVIEEYPDDVNAHVRIAEILCRHFQRYDDGIAEIRIALEKDIKPEQWAFLSNRLADIHVEYRRDFVAAREALQEILIKLPDTKYAAKARERVLALNEKEAHERLPPRPPLKVADHPEGESM